MENILNSPRPKREQKQALFIKNRERTEKRNRPNIEKKEKRKERI